MLPMLRDPASFLTIPDKQERFPTSGNDTTCAIIYDSVYRKAKKRKNIGRQLNLSYESF